MENYKTETFTDENDSNDLCPEDFEMIKNWSINPEINEENTSKLHAEVNSNL